MCTVSHSNVLFYVLSPQERAGTRGHAYHVPVPDHQPLPNLHDPGTPEWESDKATGPGTFPVLQVGLLFFLS